MVGTLQPDFLTIEDVLEIQREQIERYGGSHGLRDRGGLESALAVPQASFGGEWLHPTIPAMAAAYLFHLCQNHAFIDGNKRVGANAAIVFLFLNGWDLLVTEAELVDLVLRVASSQLGKPELTDIFERSCRPRN